MPCKSRTLPKFARLYGAVPQNAALPQRILLCSSKLNERVPQKLFCSTTGDDIFAMNFPSLSYSDETTTWTVMPLATAPRDCVQAGSAVPDAPLRHHSI
jgi:hypothetical protein